MRACERLCRGSEAPRRESRRAALQGDLRAISAFAGLNRGTEKRSEALRGSGEGDWLSRSWPSAAPQRARGQRAALPSSRGEQAFARAAVSPQRRARQEGPVRSRRWCRDGLVAARLDRCAALRDLGFDMPSPSTMPKSACTPARAQGSRRALTVQRACKATGQLRAGGRIRALADTDRIRRLPGCPRCGGGAREGICFHG
jgi:hypothetical protein